LAQNQDNVYPRTVVSVSLHAIYATKYVGPVQSGHHHLIKVKLVLAHDIILECSIAVKQQSPTHSLTNI